MEVEKEAVIMNMSGRHGVVVIEKNHPPWRQSWLLGVNMGD